ncbi:MAG: 3-hydroxyacyl-CoA dehydrogenase NAD-binding domain-containing protein [Comamonadaceae bacterium]|nr:3-hydroxyacyl-CoA dehydrogenase NAD-binding domain-containing protein [Comamonadaceae bacterium]
MHFFNPAPRMKLVEVVSGVETALLRSRALLAATARPGARARCTPSPRRASSSTGWRGRSTARPGACCRRGALSIPFVVVCLTLAIRN